MIGRIWLIARREIVAYAGAPSFWFALLIGPILMIAGLFASQAMKPAPAPVPTAEVVAADPELAQAAARALQAGGMRLLTADAAAAAGTRVVIASPDASTAAVELQRAPLPADAAVRLDAELRATLAERMARRLGEPAIHVSVTQPVVRAAPAATPLDIGRFGRFGMAMLLWLTLIGALGMLLQAVVRERTHRALEGLMSAVRPVEIVLGKLIGVGLVSMIVLSAWMAGGAGVAALGGGAQGQLFNTLIQAAFGDPARLAAALVVYLLAFAMYGAAILAVGALARDVASAQNLSRPVFGVLLMVFFAALSQLGGPAALPAWTVWAPPVTPFALLLAAPGSLAWVSWVGGLAIMALATAGGLTLAARLLVAQLDGARKLWKIPARTPDPQAQAA